MTRENYKTLCVTFVVIFLICNDLSISIPIRPASDQFELVVCHTNDVHAKFEEISATGGACRPPTPCFGGIARLATKMRQIRSNNDNVLLLDAGDQFQGSMWFNKFAHRPSAHFMNRLNYDAMCVGNHEFDIGVSKLLKFINATNFPVLSANIDPRLQADAQGLIDKSTVVVVGDRKIGIVGYTTEEAPYISSTGNLLFEPIVNAVQNEVDQLIGEGVDIIIALGHAGISMDIKIAQNVIGVDLVVGGHTHTFMYSTDEDEAYPNIERSPYGYPHIVNSLHNGKQVPVVQAFENGKYLGMLKMIFDKDGNLKSWGGNPILLDQSIDKAKSILQRMVPYQKRLSHSKPIGSTNVLLDGSRIACRLQECNLGNLIADAIVDQFQVYPTPNAFKYSPTIGFINGGSVRSTITYENNGGTIESNDLSLVLPFGGRYDILELKGKYLRAAFDHSANSFRSSDPSGAFLQVSGIRVIYDLNKPIGERLISIRVLCNNITECPVPIYKELDDESIYRVVTNDFLSDGRDGYDAIKAGTLSRVTGNLDVSVVKRYIQKMSPIHTGLEDRILFQVGNETRTSAIIS